MTIDETEIRIIRNALTAYRFDVEDARQRNEREQNRAETVIHSEMVHQQEVIDKLLERLVPEK